MSWGRHRTRSNHYAAWFFTFPSGIFIRHCDLVKIYGFKFTRLHSRAPTVQATAGQLPFEAGVGLRGQKARKLQADLRKQEAGHSCCIVHHSFGIRKGFQGAQRVEFGIFVPSPCRPRLSSWSRLSRRAKAKKCARSAETQVSFHWVFKISACWATHMSVHSIKYVSSWLMYTILSLPTDILKYII